MRLMYFWNFLAEFFEEPRLLFNPRLLSKSKWELLEGKGEMRGKGWKYCNPLFFILKFFSVFRHFVSVILANCGYLSLKSWQFEDKIYQFLHGCKINVVCRCLTTHWNSKNCIEHWTEHFILKAEIYFKG